MSYTDSKKLVGKI